IFTPLLYLPLLPTPPPPHELYPLSLHDALPISPRPTVAVLDLDRREHEVGMPRQPAKIGQKLHTHHTLATQKPVRQQRSLLLNADRKSTRLNSSHGSISYAVFCLKKKNTYKVD